MGRLKSLFSVFWKPEAVLGSNNWFAPYVASALLLGLFGLYTRFRMGVQIATQLQQLGVTSEGIALFNRGTYIGVVVVSLAVPLFIPWVVAFISKFVALFSGSRVSFSEFFAIYQWGYYVSTVVALAVKGVLFMVLPVSAWGGVTLSLALLAPKSMPALVGIANAIDISVVLLFGVALLALKARQKRPEWSIPVWAMCIFVALQASLMA